ncbi:MAG: 3D domain-containing protein [Candidatus Hydrogenedentales bacterium]
MTRTRFCLGAVLVMTFVLCSSCATHPKKPHGGQAYNREMEVTAYDAGKKSCNWKRNWLLQPVVASGPNKGQPKKVGITASGTRARPGTLAADTDYYPFGTVIYVPGYGYGRVEDRGGAIKGPDKLDVFFKSRKKALQWGRRRVRVRVWPG